MRRRPRIGLVLPALVALLSAALVPRAAAAGETGRVVEVIDGDTLRVRPPGGGAATIRLIGIDAPEKAHPTKTREYHAEEALDSLRALCDGREVRLLPDAEEEDGYGRLLRYVYLPARGPSESGEILVNLEMVRRGHARAVRRFRHSLQEDFLAAEERARREGLGIWADRGMAELRWLRDAGARPVEVWPAADGKYIVAYRGTARPSVERGDVGRSVDGILRLHGELAGEELARECENAGFLPEAGTTPGPGTPPDARRAKGTVPSSGPSSTPAVVPWEQAGRHAGQTVTVEGKIVRTSKGANVLFLNFHPNWKRHVTIVIPGSALKLFPADAGRLYKDRVVRVTGEVALYKGRPEIVVRSPDAIAIVR